MKKINSYEVLERVGRGGMGTVYKVRHTLRNEILALKQLNDDSPEIQRRFENEAVVLSKLSHPNIVQVSDFFSFENELYIAMEFVDGKPLSDIIGKEVGPIVSEKAVPLFNQILSGISHAHHNGIVHRDLKPANILVTSDGKIKITDFGIAKVMGATMGTAGMKMGTIYYMSPEQMEGEETDERSDIYSLGMTFYEMLAGRLPFNFATTSNPFAIMKQVHDSEIPDPREFYPHIPENIVAAVMKAIVKNKNHRFRTVDEFISAFGGKIEKLVGGDEHIPKSKTSKFIKYAHNEVQMVYVEGGEFLMGSREGESDEKPVHQTQVESFLIGKFPVTQELWESVMGYNPSYFLGKNKPVDFVSWYNVIEFCNKLSEKEGLTKAYSEEAVVKTGFFGRIIETDEVEIVCNFDTDGYRLPTEAEWEFAAIGGPNSEGYRFAGSDELNDVGWYADNSDQTKEVGKKKPNELKIYEMSGNIWEWCWDWYDKYSFYDISNPVGPNSGVNRVTRGGSWDSVSDGCRSTFRNYDDPDCKNFNLGFRIARTFFGHDIQDEKGLKE